MPDDVIQKSIEAKKDEIYATVNDQVNQWVGDNLLSGHPTVSSLDIEYDVPKIKQANKDENSYSCMLGGRFEVSVIDPYDKDEVPLASFGFTVSLEMHHPGGPNLLEIDAISVSIIDDRNQ